MRTLVQASDAFDYLHIWYADRMYFSHILPREGGNHGVTHRADTFREIMLEVANNTLAWKYEVIDLDADDLTWFVTYLGSHYE